MNLSLFIARRYLLSKKKVSSINLISAISIIGVALSAAAMLCTLSVFNGFEEMVASLFTSFDPQIKIVSLKGKTLDAEKVKEKLKDIKEIELISLSIEEPAMVRYKDRQEIALVKGVDESFEQTTAIDSILIGEGQYRLKDGAFYYCIPSVGLATRLATGIRFTDALEIYTPRQDEGVNIANPATAFKKSLLHSSGLIFMVGQDKYDDRHLLCDLGFAQQIFQYSQNQATSIGVKLKEGSHEETIKQAILKALSDPGDYQVLDRYEQQQDVFKIMELEKMVSYLFGAFILLIASFNIIGAMSMLIVDKKEDIRVLQVLGADTALIKRIFFVEGWLISLLGAFLGLLLGLLLIWIQETFGIISLGSDFIIEDYPVSLHLLDVFLVLGTVALTGMISALYPARYALKKECPEN